MKKYTVSVASMIMALVFIAGAPQTANAGMVGTPNLLSQGFNQQDQQQSRQAIESQLVELGVDPQMAKSRTASLSDQQVADISSRLSDMPAGADAGGILLTIFIVFVITDVIGATDIFPFIHPVK